MTKKHPFRVHSKQPKFEVPAYPIKDWTKIDAYEPNRKVYPPMTDEEFAEAMRKLQSDAGRDRP